MDEWSAGCDQSVRCGTLVQYIEIELPEVQRRYDKFGNLIEETIRELKIKLQVTKDNEVCILFGVFYCILFGVKMTFSAKKNYVSF